MPQPQVEWDLTEYPAGALNRSVTATPGAIEGRPGLRVSLTDEVTRDGVPEVDYIDMPTFVLLPVDFENGTLQVDICSRLRADAPDYARGFAGLAYRVTGGGERFESVYVRPTNGRKLSPGAPRDQRAIQYYAYPDWKFDRLREEYPDGRFEASTDIGPGEWLQLLVDVEGTRLTASVDGQVVLDLPKTKADVARGQIGLWVDIGTEAWFANLVVTSR